MGIRQVDTMEPPSLMLTTSPSFDEEIGLTSPNKLENSSKSGRSRKASERSSRTSSPSSPSSSERRRKRRNNNKSPTNHRHREVSPERDPVMKLAMCGADINDEVKMALVDVQVSLRQIVSTVRTFGPEEKECVRATLKDMKSTVKNKVRQLAVCTSSTSSTQPPRETKVTFSL